MVGLNITLSTGISIHNNRSGQEGSYTGLVSDAFVCLKGHLMYIEVIVFAAAAVWCDCG